MRSEKYKQLEKLKNEAAMAEKPAEIRAEKPAETKAAKTAPAAAKAEAPAAAEKIKPAKKRRPRKGKAGKVILTLVIILAVLAGGLYAVADHFLDKIQREGDIEIVDPKDEIFDDDNQNEDDDPGIGEDPDDPSGDENPGTPDNPDEDSGNPGEDKPVSPDPGDPKARNPEDVPCKTVDLIPGQDGLINILLVGQDDRPGQKRQRSDTMIVCSYNPKTKEVSLISFMRDLYVHIPGGYSDNRLNLPYLYGGFSLLRQTLAEDFGVKTDGGFALNFETFKDVINIIGGIDITLNAEEASKIPHAQEGENHMNGAMALDYVRLRKVSGSDFGRTERQRKALIAVYTKLKGCSVSEIMDVVNAVLPKMTTDMKNSEIMKIATELAKDISGLKISSYRIPGSGEYESIHVNKMSVLYPNTDKIVKRLKNTILPLE